MKKYIDKIDQMYRLKTIHKYFKSDDLSVLTSKVNKELTKVKCRLDCSKLAVNIDKTNFVYFHSTRKKIPDSVIHRLGKDIIKG